MDKPKAIEGLGPSSQATSLASWIGEWFEYILYIIQQQGTKVMAAIDDLKASVVTLIAAVGGEGTAVASAATKLQTISTQLAGLANGNADIEAAATAVGAQAAAIETAATNLNNATSAAQAALNPPATPAKKGG